MQHPKTGITYVIMKHPYNTNLPNVTMKVYFAGTQIFTVTKGSGAPRMRITVIRVYCDLRLDRPVSVS